VDWLYIDGSQIRIDMRIMRVETGEGFKAGR
jgi:hypothetical protein